jgi:CheY-like chemotaxis protein
MRAAIQRTIDISGLPLQCLTAEHGNAALSVLEKHRVDLMLIDLHMPELRGDDLIRHLAQQPDLAAIPFVVMSADTTVTRVQEMLDLGALAYIPKPFAPATLRTEMSKALEQIHASN